MRVRGNRAVVAAIISAAIVITIFLVILFVSQLDHSSPQLNNYEKFIRERLDEAELIYSRAKIARHLAIRETPIPHDNPWSATDFRNFWDYFYPSYNCPHSVERIGRVGDGGKWICGLSHLKQRLKSCVVYSYGISKDTSFEEDVLSRTDCNLRAYDHTVKLESLTPALEKFAPRMTYFPLGIWKEQVDQMRTLRSEMERHGDTFIEILKLDIESAEFETLPQILSDFPDGLPFGQLLVELHVDALPAEGRFRKVFEWWEKLEEAGLRVFRNEPNLFPVLLGHYKHQSFCEFSFLNVKVDHVLLHG